MGAEGYVTTDVAEEADMVLFNTCHIREKASEKLYSDLGRLRKLKADKPDLKVGVAGCVAQAEGAEILRRSPVVDLVVGPQAYHRLPDLVARARRTTPLSAPNRSASVKSTSEMPKRAREARYQANAPLTSGARGLTSTAA